MVITNDYFFNICGLSDEYIFSKTGIRNRRRTRPHENTNTMATDAVSLAIPDLPYSIQDVDLIIGATYTPYDTACTLAHYIQKKFSIKNAKCFTIDSACSSFVNAMEIADCFFALGKAKLALLVISENNSAYCNDSDRFSGFIWGDGASAVFVSNQVCSRNDINVLDINTTGLGHVGKSIESVYLRPGNGGLRMPFGKDVFHYACTYIIDETINILKKNNIPLKSVDYFIPHQANARIIEYVAKNLGFPKSSVINIIEHFGNTGSASVPIALSQHRDNFLKDDLIVISVFGGGYSSGSVLLKKL